MFDIDRQAMMTQIRSRNCLVVMEINTDQRRLVERSVAEFARDHHCLRDRLPSPPPHPHLKNQIKYLQLALFVGPSLRGVASTDRRIPKFGSG
jgi:hypothetical protein